MEVIGSHIYVTGIVHTVDALVSIAQEYFRPQASLE